MHLPAGEETKTEETKTEKAIYKALADIQGIITRAGIEQTGGDAPPEIYNCLEKTITTSLQEDDQAFDMTKFHKEWIKRLTDRPLPNKERHALITALKNSTNATTIELGHMTGKELTAIPEYDPEQPEMGAGESTNIFQASPEEFNGIQGKEPPAAEMLDYITTLEKVDLSQEDPKDNHKVIQNTALQKAAVKSLRMVSVTFTPIILAIMVITTTTAQDRTVQTDSQLRQAGEHVTIEGLHIRMAMDKKGNLLMGATSSTHRVHITHLEHEFKFTEAEKAERQLNSLISNTSKAHNRHIGTEFPEIHQPIDLSTTLKEACDCHLTDTTTLEIINYSNSQDTQTESTDRWVYNHTEISPDTCNGPKGPERYEVTTGANDTCTINPTPLTRATLIKRFANMTAQQIDAQNKPCIARGHYNINQLAQNNTKKTRTATLVECMTTCHFTPECTRWMYNTATTTCWTLSLEKAHTFTTTQYGTIYAGGKKCIPCEMATHLKTPPNCTLRWDGRPQTKIRCPCITKETLRQNMDSLKTIRGRQQRNSIKSNNQTKGRTQSLGRALNQILAQATKQTIHTLHQILMGQQNTRPGANTHLWYNEPMTSLKEYLSPAKITSIIRIGAKELYKLWKDSPPQNLHTETQGEITEYTAKHNFTPLTTEGQLTHTELKRDAMALADFVSDSDTQKKKVTQLKTLPHKLKPFYATKTPQGAQAILITADTGDSISKIALLPMTTEQMQTEIALLAIPREIGADHGENPTATGIRQLTPESINHQSTAGDKGYQTLERCFSQMAAGEENPDNCSTQDTPQTIKATTVLSIRTQTGPKRLIRLCHTNSQEMTIKIRCGANTNIERNKGVIILLLEQTCRISSQTGKTIAAQMTESHGQGHSYHLLYNEAIQIREDWQGPDETTASLLGLVMAICLGILADKIRSKCKHRRQSMNTEPTRQLANSTNSIDPERRSPAEWQATAEGGTES